MQNFFIAGFCAAYCLGHSAVASADEIVTYDSKRRCGTAGIEVTFRHDTDNSVVTDLDVRTYCVNDSGEWELVTTLSKPASGITVSSDGTFSHRGMAVLVEGKIETAKKKANGTVRSSLIPLCTTEADLQQCKSWDATAAR